MQTIGKNDLDPVKISIEIMHVTYLSNVRRYDIKSAILYPNFLACWNQMFSHTDQAGFKDKYAASNKMFAQVYCCSYKADID